MRRILAITILALLCSLSAFAQITVKGVVKDSSGIPLPGVGVVEKGSRRGVISGDDGAYSITLKSQDSVLEFSCLGMKTHTENISGRNVIDVTMEDDAIGLEEVVAIGYGSIKREEITTAVSRVKSDDFIKGGVTSPLSLLQGKVAGLGMSVTSGDPGASPSISFRGISTLAASTSPLIVIDGIAGGNLNSISPEDIESIDVLKDGSAAAIYGTRGTNGVIIINTRQAASGKFELEYDGYVKFDMLEGDHDRLSAAEWREKMTHSDIYPGMQDWGGTTDWVRSITRNPFSHNHYLSARGSLGRSSYVASVDYSSKQGIYKTSFDNSLAVKLGIRHSMIDGRLKMEIDLHDKVVSHGYCPDELYNDASLRNPTYPLYDENGAYFQTNSQSPLCALNEWKGVDKYNWLSLRGRLSFEPVKNLILSATGSYQNYYDNDEWSGTHKTYSAIYGGEKGSATISSSHIDDYTLDLQAEWSASFADHNLMLTAGYSYNKHIYQTSSMKAYNFPVDGFGVWNIGTAESTLDGLSKLKSSKSEHMLAGFFARVNYNWHNRYLLMLSLRCEGSSRFGANNRWGVFPAVSAGWRITNEEFMKGVRWINELKLRAGYGVTGTEPSNSYSYIALYNFNTSYMSYVDGKWVNGIIPSNNPNPDLKWEEKHEANVGLDFALLSSRLRGSIDGYYRYTKDLLYDYTVPTPPNISGSILANVGSIMNAGVELELEGDAVRSKGFTLTLGGNFSYNTNKLLKLSNDLYTLEYLKLGNLTHVQTYSHRLEEGWPIGNFYAWKQLGLKGNGTSWRIKGAENSTAGEDQKTVVGNGIPKMFAGFHITASYWGFDLTVSFHGAFKYQILNQYRMMYETLAWLQTYNVPRKAYEKIGDYYNYAPSTYCDYYIENGDYVKLDNITLGYTLKPARIKWLQSIRWYFTGKNLLTFTRYSGMDPEAVRITGLTPGVDALQKYPTIRSLTAGMNIIF